MSLTKDVAPRSDLLRVALLQTAPRLGDVESNLAELDELVAESSDTDVAVAPELALHGYFVGDLPVVDGLSRTDPRLAALGQHEPAVVAGFVERWRHHHFNAAAIVDDGRVHVQRKLFLPNYQAWEEHKHFRPGDRLHELELCGARVGVLVCNDLWHPPVPWLAAHAGAEVLVVIANSVDSESTVSVQESWDLLLRHTAVTLQCYVVFVNRVGTESGQRFWGGSCAVGLDGEPLLRLGDQVDRGGVRLDLAALRAARVRWPMLKESRFELIAREATRLAEAERD